MVAMAPQVTMFIVIVVIVVFMFLVTACNGDEGPGAEAAVNLPVAESTDNAQSFPPIKIIVCDSFDLTTSSFQFCYFRACVTQSVIASNCDANNTYAHCGTGSISFELVDLNALVTVASSTGLESANSSDCVCSRLSYNVPRKVVIPFPPPIGGNISASVPTCRAFALRQMCARPMPMTASNNLRATTTTAEAFGDTSCAGTATVTIATARSPTAEPTSSPTGVATVFPTSSVSSVATDTPSACGTAPVATAEMTAPEWLAAAAVIPRSEARQPVSATSTEYSFPFVSVLPLSSRSLPPQGTVKVIPSHSRHPVVEDDDRGALENADTQQLSAVPVLPPAIQNVTFLPVVRITFPPLGFPPIQWPISIPLLWNKQPQPLAHAQIQAQAFTSVGHRLVSNLLPLPPIPLPVTIPPDAVALNEDSFTDDLLPIHLHVSLSFPFAVETQRIPFTLPPIPSPVLPPLPPVQWPVSLPIPIHPPVADIVTQQMHWPHPRWPISFPMAQHDAVPIPPEPAVKEEDDEVIPV
jgi:hypothetical protein